jgi:pimeloyl-ACP methyl ester carboxylesterase
MPDWALAIGAGLLGWVVFGSVYAAAANLRWPASGRHVRIKGGRLHVALHDGEGPLVAALHGASANGREFSAVAAALNGKARVAAIDRPGYGHSSRPAGAATLARQAEMIGECLDALDPGPVIVLAHSLGCATALRLALERPDKVAGLVLVAPAANPYPGPNAWHVRLAARPIAGLLFARLAVPLVGPLLAQGAIAKTFAPAPVPKGYAGAAAVGLLFRPKTFRANAQDVLATKTEFEAQYFRYDEINAPAIVITADSDRVVSPRIHARALARVLPKAELVVTPGAGHMPHHIRPEAVTAAILRIAQIAGSESL